ncbi:MAG: AEC family transporter [Deltaproteobacteria bacterium]
MLLESVKTTFAGVVPGFALGIIGFCLFRWKVLREEGLDTLSTLAIDVTLPLLMFYRLAGGFDFRKYPDWWQMPLLSIAITVGAFIVGLIFIRFFEGDEKRNQFLSLVAFQNSGYLPLVMAAAMFTGDKLNLAQIYLFLFLLGFNLVLFSFGVYLLTKKSGGRFDFRKFLNAPVIATFIGLGCAFAGIGRFIPSPVMKAVGMAGDCTMPLAMFVVGGNIAAIKLMKVDFKAMPLLVLVKLILLPAAGLALVHAFRLPEIVGLLLVLQLAMPPATNLSVLVRQYRQDDVLVSQGIFFGHVAGLVTIPVFLSLYFMLTMIK